MSDERWLSTAGATGSAVVPTLQASIIRVFDIILASLGLLVTAPLFPIIAIFIKLDSKGPVFYPAPRVGKGMQIFPMFKFRTMLESSTAIDQSICAQYDPRVTTAGRLLRRTKLNELPQLLNILRGEMSFVGPRPEAPNLAERYPEEAKVVFSVKPGLVGPVVISSLRGEIKGRNEEELYPQGVDAENYYIEHILPEKVKIDMYHLSRQTVSTYFNIILAAAKETLFGALNGRRADHGNRQVYLFMADTVAGLVSYGFAYRIYLRTAETLPSFKMFISGLLLVMILRPLLFYALGLYKFVMELVTRRDTFRAVQAVALGSLLLSGLNALRLTFSYPLVLALMDFVLLSVLLAGGRLVIMARYRVPDSAAPDSRPWAVIFGANREGLKALHALGGSKKSPYRIIGFIDDAEEKYAKKISGLKVLGNRHHIGAIGLLYNVQEVILAPEDRLRDRLDEVVALCARAGLRSRMFDTDAAEGSAGPLVYPVRAVQLADMLPQVRVPMDEPALRAILSGKTTLMMGSGGELGSAVCRHLFHLGCRKLVIIDRYESRLSQIMAELIRDLPGFEMIPVVADSQDVEALDRVFVRYRPRIVLHAGMRKFIPFQKTTDEEIARANYISTFNLAKVSARRGCEYFLVISSINAARRGSFISESLRVAEISLSRIFGPTPTRLIVTRVGNIIENSGGIVAWLNEQILQRKPIPLASESARAYLLSKDAGARSILQSLATGSRMSPGGLLLTSEPGISLEYSEVARRIARFYGLKPGFDIAVDLGEIPDALLRDEPSAITAASDLAAAVNLKNYLDSDRARDIIQSLISGDIGPMSKQEWYRRTEEILALCSPSSPAKKKSVSLN